MQLRTSTLVDNTVSWLGLLAEWGLSILVETDEKSVLLDAGRSSVAAYNAPIMGVDVTKIDTVVFSHGHEDHTGGLIELLKVRNLPENPVTVITHPDSWQPKYWRLSASGTDTYKYIGIPYVRKLAESFGASFHDTADPVWITDHIVTSGEVPMETALEEIDANAFVETDEGYSPDPLRDDQSLFVITERGLVVVAGCAHRGIINIIRHAQHLTDCDDVYAVLGGIHLFGASADRITWTIEEFKRLDIQKIGVSHCTGSQAGTLMAHEFGDRFFFNQAGISTDFGV